MQEQIGALKLFEGSPEGPDQVWRQVANKTDSVGNDGFPLPRKAKSATGGVEGGEELVGDAHFAGGQNVEEGGLPGVGVSHDGDDGQTALLSSVSPKLPLVGELFNLPLQAGHPLPGATTVDFQLGLTGASPTDAPGESREPGIEIGETGEVVFELSELYLELSVTALGVLCEDVEDELCSVDDFQLGEAGDGSGLGGSEVVVEDYQLAVQVEAIQDDLFEFAFSHDKLGVHFVSQLNYGVLDGDAGGSGELLHLFDSPLGHRAVGVDSNEDGRGLAAGGSGGLELSAELFLEVIDEKLEVNVRLKHRAEELIVVRGRFVTGATGGGQKVGDLQLARLSIFGDVQGGNKIEPQFG